jgi:AcrR family transcriptional regulator
MPEQTRLPSARQQQLLEAAYAHTLEHGLAGLSLRPLAAAIGSSPRVLLFLFGSKEGLIRALLARARAEELAMLDRLRATGTRLDLPATMAAVWEWLSSDAHRPLLAVWVEAYGRALVEPDGPWAGFAEATVRDWLALVAAAQSQRRARSRAGVAQQTLALAVLRGALLDLLATGDADRTTSAVTAYIAGLRT